MVRPCLDSHWLRLDPIPNDLGGIEDRIAGRTTHLRTWPGSARLLDFLERTGYVSPAGPPQAELLGPAAAPTPRYLELGSGTGWFGLSLALNLPERAELVLTEAARAVPRLLENVASARRSVGGDTPLRNVRCAECDWDELRALGAAAESSECKHAGALGHAAPEGNDPQHMSPPPTKVGPDAVAGAPEDSGIELLRAKYEPLFGGGGAGDAGGDGASHDRRPFDLVLGSELTWQVGGAQAFVAALAFLLKSGRARRALYAHNPVYSLKAHEAFLASCEEHKFRLVDVLLQARTIDAGAGGVEGGGAHEEPGAASMEEGTLAAHAARAAAGEQARAPIPSSDVGGDGEEDGLEDAAFFQELFPEDLAAAWSQLPQFAIYEISVM